MELKRQPDATPALDDPTAQALSMGLKLKSLRDAGRIPCEVPWCSKTKSTADGGEAHGYAWICGDHWGFTERPLRQAFKASLGFMKAETDPEKRAALAQVAQRRWEGLVGQATRGAAGIEGYYHEPADHQFAAPALDGAERSATTVDEEPKENDDG